MAVNSKIEWTHHTFNPWRGCTKVSPGCANCYAETMSKRNPAVLGVWGDNGTRIVAVDSYWKQPLKWNRDAEKAGERRRVFCASLADVFEDRDELINPRYKLFNLIECTHNLDWLLLTKRPENVNRLLEESKAGAWLERNPHVWIGTTVENQEMADKRIPELLKIPAAVRFLSCEPLLGPVDVSQYLRCGSCLDPSVCWCADPRVDWVICGGESGPNARPMHPDWARSLRNQCKAAGVPFFFKQWGEWLPGESKDDETTYKRCDNGQLYASSGNRPRQNFGTHKDIHSGNLITLRIGKIAAGRLLDGAEHNEFPASITD